VNTKKIVDTKNKKIKIKQVISETFLPKEKDCTGTSKPHSQKKTQKSQNIEKQKSLTLAFYLLITAVI